jgi:hypothetical protein
MHAALATTLDSLLDLSPASRPALLALERALRAESEPRLTGTPHASEVALGTDCALAAIELGLACTALGALPRWRERGLDASALIRDCLLRAAQPLGRVALPLAVAPSAGPDHAEADADTATVMDLGVMRNIAVFHREHERYYTLSLAESAVELFREANKLRVLALVVSRDALQAPRADVDFTLPQYAAAGCVDLNEPAAIASIGALFMEGEGEPSELRVLKARLGAMAQAGAQAGAWLADKASQAWRREQALLRPELVALAAARFGTILTNGRVARHTQLVARLAGLALARLGSTDLRPSAVRAARGEAAQALFECGAMLASAAQIKAQDAAALAGNDRLWTEYLERLPPRIHA